MFFASVSFLGTSSGVYVRDAWRNETVSLCPDVLKPSPFLVEPDHCFYKMSILFTDGIVGKCVQNIILIVVRFVVDPVVSTKSIVHYQTCCKILIRNDVKLALNILVIPISQIGGKFSPDV